MDTPKPSTSSSQIEALDSNEQSDHTEAISNSNPKNDQPEEEYVSSKENKIINISPEHENDNLATPTASPIKEPDCAGGRKARVTITAQGTIRPYLQQAADLLASQCTSDVKMVSTEPLVGVQDPPPGFGGPRTFFIHQRKPRPMTPLRVWRGYHGNVYFEPIKLNTPAAKPGCGVEPKFRTLESYSPELQRIISKTRLNPAYASYMRERNKLLASAPFEKRQSVPKTTLTTKAAVVLDQNIPLKQITDPEELRLLHSQKSTGTLQLERSHTWIPDSNTTGVCGQVRPAWRWPNGNKPRAPEKVNQRTYTSISSPRHITEPATAERSRVCRGSVSRKLNMVRSLMLPSEKTTVSLYEKARDLTQPWHMDYRLPSVNTLPVLSIGNQTK